MKFIQEYGCNDWWEYDEEHQLAVSYFGNFHNVNPQSITKILEANDWKDLYKRYAQLGFDTGMFYSMWISPNGKMFPSEVHQQIAEAIVDVIYDKDTKYAEDFLMDNHWIKVTTSSMLVYYIQQGYYKSITALQYKRLSEWCQRYNINIDLLGIRNIVQLKAEHNV